MFNQRYMLNGVFFHMKYNISVLIANNKGCLVNYFGCEYYISERMSGYAIGVFSI